MRPLRQGAADGESDDAVLPLRVAAARRAAGPTTRPNLLQWCGGSSRYACKSSWYPWPSRRARACACRVSVANAELVAMRLVPYNVNAHERLYPSRSVGVRECVALREKKTRQST
jgi:hypothetical protein